MPPYLVRLTELEMADKADRSVNARIAPARFPVIRTLEKFDFMFQLGLSAMRVRKLANLALLDHPTGVLLISGPQSARRTWRSASGLLSQTQCAVQLRGGSAGKNWVAAEVSYNLGKMLAHLQRVDLLDELGCAPNNRCCRRRSVRPTRARVADP